MVDAGGECKFGGFEGVVGGEVDVEEEDTTLEGGVGGAQDSGLKVQCTVLQATLYCTPYCTGLRFVLYFTLNHGSLSNFGICRANLAQ